MNVSAPSRLAFCWAGCSPLVVVAALFMLALTACSESPTGNGADRGPERDDAVVSPTTAADIANLSTTTRQQENTDSGSTTEAETGTDELSAMTGLIVRRNDKGEIVVSAPSGERSLVIGSAQGTQNSQPTWSSGGDKVAWTSLSPTGAELAIADVSQPSAALARSASLSPIFYLSWSADDSAIAGLRNGREGIELVIADPESAALETVGPGQPFFFDWQNGNTLTAAIGGQFLADIRADIGEVQPRSLPGPLGVFSAPIATADGTIVAIEQNRTNVITLLGDEPSELATAVGPVLFSLDPAGTRLAVLVVGDSGDGQVIGLQTRDLPELPLGKVSIIDLDTGSVQTRPENNIVAMSWSPNGKRLALLESTTKALRWLFVEQDQVVTAGTAFIPSQEFANSYLPFVDQYERSSTWWSPDSGGFVFSGTVGTVSGVWVERVASGLTATRIGDGDIAFWSPR